MFGKVLSSLFYVSGTITVAIGLIIGAMIAFNLPGYIVPILIGFGLIATGAVTKNKLQPAS